MERKVSQEKNGRSARGVQTKWISDEEWEEGKKRGKENAYQQWKKILSEVADQHQITFREAAICLSVINYRNFGDIFQLLEWVDHPEFMEKLREEYEIKHPKPPGVSPAT